MARTYTTVGWEDGTILQPATVTVQGTQYNVEPQVVSGTTPINATNLRKMDNEIKRVVEEDIPSVLDVVLIAVTDTAPSECAKDDKYYNTTDNKIYTATATNTWSQDGDYPVEGIMYILFGTQSSYAYNGTTLVSVGGGSGDLIIVGNDSDITENTKLLIEEDDLNADASGTYITNAYSESTTLGYSADYANQHELNATVVWTNPNPNQAFSNQTININLSNYDCVEIYYKKGIGTGEQMIKAKINGSISLFAFQYVDGSGDCMVVRPTVVGTTSVVFDHAYALGIGTNANAGEKDDTVIPTSIIGYKTGLFS